jgi:hypothetical protein
MHSSIGLRVVLLGLEPDRATGLGRSGDGPHGGAPPCHRVC